MPTSPPCVLIEAPGMMYQQWNRPKPYKEASSEDDQRLDPRVVIDFSYNYTKYFRHEMLTSGTTVPDDLDCFATDAAFSKVESAVPLLRSLPSENFGFVRRNFLKHVGEAVAGYSFLRGMAELRIRVVVTCQSLQEGEQVGHS